jgi:hypothetical protein
MMTHDRFAAPGVTRQDVNFGEYISASVYYPTNKTTSERLPVVLWLHPLSYDSGFNEGYIESTDGISIYHAIARAGFAVIAFDQIGFGTRGYEKNGAAPLSTNTPPTLTTPPTTSTASSTTDFSTTTDSSTTAPVPAAFAPMSSGDGLSLFYERYPDWSLMGKMVHDAR